MRSHSIRICLVALCILTVAGASAVWADPPSRVGRLNYISGAVSFRSENLADWTPATVNYPLTIGDHLWTDQDGRAEVHIGSTALRLASNTEISFLNLNDQTIQIRLSTGSLNLRLRHLGAGEEIEVDTPNSSLSLLRAGTYRVDVQQNGDTTATTRSGEVEATAGSSVFPVRLEQTAEITGLDSPGYQVSAAAPPDDWDRWCQARDQRENQVASARYVPRDQIDGVEDLDEYGTWNVDVNLGPVWVPAVTIVGWAPYRFGHWVWIDPWGWTWIDDAPWGFAPFHYGRWAFRNSVWVWVPGPFMRHPVYAPAIVAFVGGGNWLSSRAPGGSVGWFPLGPREPYIPPYHSDRARLHNIDVEHFNYVNRTVPGAVTVVPSEIFVRGQAASGAALFLPNDELMRAPVHGAVAPLVPRTFPGTATRGPIAQPPAWVTSRAERPQSLSVRPEQAGSAAIIRPPVRVLTPGYPQAGVRQPPRYPAQDPFSRPYVAPPMRREGRDVQQPPQYPQYPPAGTYVRPYDRRPRVPAAGPPGVVQASPWRQDAPAAGRGGRTHSGSGGYDPWLFPPGNSAPR